MQGPAWLIYQELAYVIESGTPDLQGRTPVRCRPAKGSQKEVGFVTFGSFESTSKKQAWSRNSYRHKNHDVAYTLLIYVIKDTSFTPN
jgi:hypothetical protein